MPWHDVGVGLSGKVVSDFARHFIQRWNAHRVSFSEPSVFLFALFHGLFSHFILHSIALCARRSMLIPTI